MPFWLAPAGLTVMSHSTAPSENPLSFVRWEMLVALAVPVLLFWICHSPLSCATHGLAPTVVERVEAEPFQTPVVESVPVKSSATELKYPTVRLIFQVVPFGRVLTAKLSKK